MALSSQSGQGRAKYAVDMTHKKWFGLFRVKREVTEKNAISGHFQSKKGDNCLLSGDYYRNNTNCP